MGDLLFTYAFLIVHLFLSNIILSMKKSLYTYNAYMYVCNTHTPPDKYIHVHIYDTYTFLYNIYVKYIIIYIITLYTHACVSLVKYRAFNSS